jgi:hypothetical protein
LRSGASHDEHGTKFEWRATLVQNVGGGLVVLALAAALVHFLFRARRIPVRPRTAAVHQRGWTAANETHVAPGREEVSDAIASDILTKISVVKHHTINLLLLWYAAMLSTSVIICLTLGSTVLGSTFGFV